MSDLQKLLVGSLLAMVSSLIMGKLFRELIVLPFAWWARRSKNQVDDKIVKKAEEDLGIPDPVSDLGIEENKPEENKENK